MQTLLFIHLSLAVPNQRGLDQYFLGSHGELNLLKYMLQKLSASREINKMILLTSSAPCDGPVRLCAENLKKILPLSLSFHVVEEGKEWSFEKNNIRRNKDAPQKIKMACGAYHLGYFMHLKEVYDFDQAVLLMAESSVFLSGEYLDALIRESQGQLSCFSCQGLEPIIIAPYNEVADKICEEKSEKTQEFIYLRNLLLKKNPSPLKVECFQKELERPLYFENITRKVKAVPLPLKQGLNPFFLICTEQDYAIASHLIDLMEILKNIALISPLQWKEKISEEIFTLEENSLKREKTPFKNVVHLILDLSAFDSSREKTPETDLNAFRHFSSPPRLLTLKIRTEDLNSEYLSLILKWAKETRILSRILSLRDVPPDFEILTKKIQEGLNGLILSFPLSDWNEALDRQVESLLLYKKNNRQWQNFLIYLEIRDADSREDIRNIFDRYLFILDEIILLPPLRKKDMDMDLSDKEGCGKKCQWSRNTLVLNEKNEIRLCEEVSSPAAGFSSENWKEVFDSQGIMEVCEDCSRKGRFNGMAEGEIPLFLNNSQRKPDFLGVLKEDLFISLRFLIESEQTDFFLEVLNSLQSLGLDLREIVFYPDFQFMLHEMIRLKAYQEALSVITIQLSLNPMSREALSALDFLESSVSA